MSTLPGCRPQQSRCRCRDSQQRARWPLQAVALRQGWPRQGNVPSSDHPGGRQTNLRRNDGCTILGTRRLPRAHFEGTPTYGPVKKHRLQQHNGRYDFKSAGKSDLDPSLPAEVTDPALCGVNRGIATLPMSPAGRPGTGGGLGEGRSRPPGQDIRGGSSATCPCDDYAHSRGVDSCCHRRGHMHKFSRLTALTHR
jgi:hypothetical protein